MAYRAEKLPPLPDRGYSTAEPNQDSGWPPPTVVLTEYEVSDDRPRRPPLVNGKVQQIRDIVIMVAIVMMAGIFGYRELYPKPAQPDRIEATAEAYLNNQPLSLEKAADALDAGTLKTEGVPAYLQDARTAPANEFASALKDAGLNSSALRRAAAAQRKRMR